jgi:hypothetical protein
MKLDLVRFERSLPYASELYGVYQPILGWRSRRTEARVDRGARAARSRYLERLVPAFRAIYDLNPGVDPRESNFAVHPGVPSATARSALNISMTSIIGRRVEAQLKERGAADDPAAWAEFTKADVLDRLLSDIHDDVMQEYQTRMGQAVRTDGRDVLTSILERESRVAGVLNYLNAAGSPEATMNLLHSQWDLPPAAHASWFFEQVDPAASDLAAAVISPIGLVHLFRQYFFEFDSFLGPSVQHVWLSPGGTVELIEVSTRKTTVDQTVEQNTQTTQTAETTTTNQDELSAAVRSENSTDTKLGVSATASVGYNAAFVTGSGSISGSFSLDQNQKQAREETHKNLRQQTEKLASEIRQSYKSTFRTITETTDVTSKRYLLQNTTDKLINYELRRKMRQVGVQVQDYGSQLCWQSFVDDPGGELGVSMLVHIAQPADLSNVKEPDKPPQPDAVLPAPGMSVTAHWPDDDDGNYVGFVVRGTPIKVVPPKPGYVYCGSQVTKVSGEDMYWRARPETPGDVNIDFSTGTATLGAPDVIQVDTGDGKTTETSVQTVWVGFQTAPGGYSWDNSWDATLQVTLFFRPSQASLRAINDDYTNRMAQYSDAKSRVLQQTLFKEAADRVRAAGNVKPRRFDDLREEERTVVFRCLIRQLLAVVGITNEDHRLRHMFSELVESLFDVDRMLYFVAPEWWMPRPLHHSEASPQSVGLAGQDQTNFDNQELVSWGGAKAARPDNYYVTDDSNPAPLGSSLGWLLQLDGDNLRNAFLNAPWVKAVIPIKVGRELRAISWMSSDAIEGSDGLDSLYAAASTDERDKIVAALKAHVWDEPGLTAYYSSLQAPDITILDALRYLILRILAQQEAAQTIVVDQTDPTVGYLPTDMVFEHGFDPLAGGFKAATTQPFSIFDQWIEVLPTDQVVPVEVEYDPITGMQV